MPLHDPLDLSATLAIGAVLTLTAYALLIALLIVATDRVRRRRTADAPAAVALRGA